MKQSSRKWAILVASVTLVAGNMMPLAVYAQGVTGEQTATEATSDPQPPKTTKADRKAARKQARAKKNAELKKLEQAGYQPSQSDPYYPNKLQAAEKKAGIGQGASQ